MPLPRLAALLAVTALVTVGQLVLAQVESLVRIAARNLAS